MLAELTPVLRLRCRGFTVVELLVVIAVISVLAALLLPALKPFHHPKASRRILMVEGGDGPYVTSAQRKALNGRHRGMINVSFGDGQIKSYVPYWMYGSNGAKGAEGEHIWKDLWVPCYERHW